MTHKKIGLALLIVGIVLCGLVGVGLAANRTSTL